MPAGPALCVMNKRWRRRLVGRTPPLAARPQGGSRGRRYAAKTTNARDDPEIARPDTGELPEHRAGRYGAASEGTRSQMCEIGGPAVSLFHATGREARGRRSFDVQKDCDADRQPRWTRIKTRCRSLNRCGTVALKTRPRAVTATCAKRRPSITGRRSNKRRARDCALHDREHQGRGPETAQFGGRFCQTAAFNAAYSNELRRS
jgi:hypothetical protein